MFRKLAWDTHDCLTGLIGKQCFCTFVRIEWGGKKVTFGAHNVE